MKRGRGISESCQRAGLRDLATVGIGMRGIEFLFDFLLEFGTDVMFESRGGGVEMVFRKLEVLLKVGFPETVRADERLGAAATFVG